MPCTLFIIWPNTNHLLTLEISNYPPNLTFICDKSYFLDITNIFLDDLTYFFLSYLDKLHTIKKNLILIFFIYF